MVAVDGVPLPPAEIVNKGGLSCNISEGEGFFPPSMLPVHSWASRSCFGVAPSATLGVDSKNMGGGEKRCSKGGGSIVGT